MPEPAEIVRSLLEIIEGDDAEWLSMAELDEQAAVVARARAWLASGDAGAHGSSGDESGKEPS